MSGAGDLMSDVRLGVRSDVCPGMRRGGAERALDDAIAMAMSAADSATKWRRACEKLAANLRRVVNTGDDAARTSTYVAARDIVIVNADKLRAYRQATIDTGLELCQLERALGERLGVGESSPGLRGEP